MAATKTGDDVIREAEKHLKAAREMGDGKATKLRALDKAKQSVEEAITVVKGES